MADMRTKLTGSETPGEAKLYEIFRNRFSDNYRVWHNVTFHDPATEIDFVVAHPGEGVYVIEVKDLRLENIEGFEYKRINYRANNQVKSCKNPLNQARDNTYAIRNGLIKFDCMLNKSGRYAGKLMTPVNYAVALPNVPATAIQQKGYENSLPLKKILAQEFFEGRAYIDRDFEKTLEATRDETLTFNAQLDTEQWNAINEFMGTPVVVDITSGQKIGVFDSTQEDLVKFKIDKQILIEGPAGSGKSLVLVKRAIYMHEQYPEWEIGVFCYNAVMANFLKTLFRKEGYEKTFVVSHCGGYRYFNKKTHAFDAILIDEGQDVKPEDLQKIYNLLNPETASFTIFYDSYQSIYQKTDIEQLLLQTGFDIENTKHLVRQQRSINIIVAMSFFEAMNRADEFVHDIIEDVLSVSERYFHGHADPITAIASGSTRHFEDKESGEHISSLAESAKKHFQVFHNNTPPQMLKHLLPKIRLKVESGEAKYSDFLIIYPNRFIGHHNNKLIYSLKKAFTDNLIPFRIIDTGAYDYKSFYGNFPDFEVIEEKDNRSKADLTENVVKAMTIHQAKGLDAKYVAILGFDEVIHKNSNDEDSNTAELAYVALTRATKECYVYYIEENAAVQNLQAILEELKTS